MKPEDRIGDTIRYDGEDWIIEKVRYTTEGVYVNLTSVDGRYQAMVLIEELLRATSEENSPPASENQPARRET